MYTLFSTLLPILVMPTTIALLLVLTALGLLLRRKFENAAKVFLAALLLTWISSSQFVAVSLMESLEGGFPPIAISSVPKTDCTVLLGGMVREVGPGVLMFNDSEERFHMALELLLSGHTTRLVVTSGEQTRGANGATESEVIKSAMVEKGVSDLAVLIENQSKTTWQNALYTKPILDSINCHEPLLVTTASHMPRAVAAFEKVGVAVYPVPVGHSLGTDSKLGIQSFRPSLEALELTNAALHEWLGRAFYWLRGWN